jgi:pyruvate ferredoxin oxidoreductase alpha subunit
VTRVLLTGNDAAAEAVRLARVRSIAAYPITPQTLIVERLADWAAGRDDVEYANLESEHAMFGYAIAAARTGVRTFTATSSQGLLYAHEQLHRAARERVPLVAVNVNRSILAPWSLEPDLADSLSQRDTGWIQLYCSSAQEVLDSVLCAYRIAETVMLPVLVCSEGFLLSHTAEVLELPEPEEVDAFLPPFEAGADWVLDPDVATVFSELPEPAVYARFQRNVADALAEASALIESVADEFGERFGRPKVGSLEVTGNPDAERVLVTMATMGDTAQELLDEDDDLLLVRVHAYRPFPTARLEALTAGRRTVAVDRAPAFGARGPLGADVPRATNVIAGIGGTEVTPGTLRWALEQTGPGPIWAPEGV